MGFHHLNEGRQFKVSVNPGDYRQIDVLAVDDESAVFVECTQSETPKKKSMTSLIQRIATIRTRATHNVQKHFDVKLKVGWVIATRNIEWIRADLARAANEKIIVIQDSQIDYFEKLVTHLKHGARYQFLAHLFAGEKIAGMTIEVPATKSKMGGLVFYSFVVQPDVILKRVYVAHKANRGIPDFESYQRLISRNRLTKIAAFVDDGGQFPTNIVLNFHSKRSLRFDAKERIGGASVGTLYLPSEYGCAWVIDGQHRLFGYAHSKRAQVEGDKTTFPILAYENLPRAREAEMFVDINHEQKSVATNLLKEIYSSLNWEAADFDLRTDALSSRLVLELNSRPASALNNRVQTQGSKPSDLRCLTITQLSEPLRRKGFFGVKRPGGHIVLGPLTDSGSESYEDTFLKAYDALSDLFGFIRKTVPNHWDLGRKPGDFSVRIWECGHSSGCIAKHSHSSPAK